MPAPRFHPGRLRAAIGALVLAGATLLAHGWSLADGTVLDDWQHQKGLREHGWSPPELLRTLVIAPADFIQCWWQDRDVRWEYARPLFILCMKLVYVVIGGNAPVALHAFSLVLHFLSAVMVWRLCLRLTRSEPWSLAGGLLFILYPHAAVTVAWPSSQNAVLQTTLLLASLLCYVHASRLTRARLTATLAFWVLAILTRENALMLPVVFLAFDLAFGGRRQAWERRFVYAACAVIAAVFIAWRLAVVTHPMPDVYVRRPAGDLPEYAAWAAAKLLHYVCTAIWIAPMMIGPTGRFNPWIEVPGDCLLMLAIVLALGGGYYACTRRARGWWIWPLWILLSVLPVVPVVATPHSGYVCGVGFAAGLALAASCAGRGGRVTLGRCAAAFFLAATSVFTLLNRWQWTGMIAAERYVPAWVSVSPPTEDATDVFFVNLPFANVYVKPALVEALGPWFERVEVHALTFAPQPALIEQRSYVAQIDAQRFRVEIEGQPYFSRLLGRFLIEGFRRDGPFSPGQVVAAREFTVTVLDADSEGVRTLEFAFPRPLSDASYAFYVTTPECGAARLRFRSPDDLAREAELAAAEAVVRSLAAELESGDADAADAVSLASPVALPASRETMRRIGGALAAPAQRILDRPELTGDDVRELDRWWRREVDRGTLSELEQHWHAFDWLIKQREEVPHARMWAARAIRTDLYLTGPPFPGPRRRE